ncbi:hypothetical protein BDW59DRAFT_151681 [Aspergillus cavernicola]|uniref:Zn(2)-C6 fungal-type domain-containing protein n=1 Tax=Aspergillus cavernicola TaxID=176166 RepID=A0ABR4HUN1_9EURO
MPKRKGPQGPQSQTSDTRLRLRSFRACAECRRRKRKCDGRDPCSSCAGYGYACTLDTDLLSTTHQEATMHSEQRRQTGENIHNPDRGERVEYSSARSPSISNDPKTQPKVIWSSQKNRMLSSHSAVTLPRILGHELNDPNPPRLHSYAWNLGVRAERRNGFVSELPSFISMEECCSLCNAYFDKVHPVFGFLQQTTFFQRLCSSWAALQEDPGLEAIICGVAALGSFFSTPSHPSEPKLITHCLAILDMAHTEPLTLGNMDILAGWILRTLYLRLTTRPWIACMASHTAMHIAEALGLHREIASESVSTYSSRPQIVPVDLDLRRRYFWVAWALNYLLATEYGLVPVTLPVITCGSFADEPGTSTGKFVSLVRVLQSACEGSTADGLDKSKLESHLDRIKTCNCATEPHLLPVVRADICLCILRMMLSSSSLHTKEITGCSTITSIIQAAFDKIRVLIGDRQPWWNSLSVPFQTVCICLWFNSPSILPLLPEAMEILKLLAQTYDSHLAREAVSTAQRLTSVSRDYDLSKIKYKDEALGSSDMTPGVFDTNPFPQSPGLNPLDDWFLFSLPFSDFTHGN